MRAASCPGSALVGTGGGALALLPADRVICAKHAWLSPLSVIRFRTTGHAAEMAAQQGVRSADLLKHGMVDRIVDERPDAADEPEEFLRRMGAALAEELARLPDVQSTNCAGSGLPATGTSG
jgi:acetyl-CoA carboxylase carboxyl transferase subunit beta